MFVWAKQAWRGVGVNISEARFEVCLCLFERASLNVYACLSTCVYLVSVLLRLSYSRHFPGNKHLIKFAVEKEI